MQVLNAEDRLKEQMKLLLQLKPKLKLKPRPLVEEMNLIVHFVATLDLIKASRHRRR